jgi:hypothetical protein
MGYPHILDNTNKKPPIRLSGRKGLIASSAVNIPTSQSLAASYRVYSYCGGSEARPPVIHEGSDCSAQSVPLHRYLTNNYVGITRMRNR